MPVYVLTFEDYEPSPRDDGSPWTYAEIRESDAEAGDYTLIDTITLSPVDTDPADPQPRSFTTKKATLAAGWYRVDFFDASGAQSPSEPIYHTNARANFLPTLGEVGALLRIRTRDARTGVELGTFTENTRPTDDQVRLLIVKADSKVAARFGNGLPETLREKTRTVTAIRAAMLVELSFFGDQIRAGRSPYTELKELHDEEWKELVADWVNLGLDQTPGTSDDAGGGLPVFWFPTSQDTRAPGAEHQNCWPWSAT